MVVRPLTVHLCPRPSSGSSNPLAFSWHWWYVVMAIAGAVTLAVLLAVYVAKLRRKETRFGCVKLGLSSPWVEGRDGAAEPNHVLD